MVRSSMGKLYPGGLFNKIPLDINSQGITPAGGKLTTQDGQATMNIAAQTKLLTKERNPLSIITVENVSSPPNAPGGDAMVTAYNFGPEGATFDPGLDLNISYDPFRLPQDISENNLYLAYFDGNQWQGLESNLDLLNKTITAKITHFSTYALMGKVLPMGTPTSSPSPSPTLPPSPTPTSDIRPTSTPGAELYPLSAVTPTPTEQLNQIQTPTSIPSPKMVQQANLTILIAITVVAVLILAGIMITLRRRRGGQE